MEEREVKGEKKEEEKKDLILKCNTGDFRHNLHHRTITLPLQANIPDKAHGIQHNMV